MTDKRPITSPEKNIELLAARVDELRQSLQQMRPAELAANTAADFSIHNQSEGFFELNFWETPTVVSFPGYAIKDALSGRELPVFMQALILYYFFTADGTPLSNQWISFSELQDGRFYTQAFQGYTGRQLAQIFQDDLEAFSQAALASGGKRGDIGDASFIFPVLPKVNLLIAAWQGDEDFPSNYQLLFNASVNHYLPTDACAIAGSMLTRKIIRASHAR